MTVATRALPHWDMTPLFPGLDSPEFAASFQRAIDDIADLATTFDALGINKRDAAIVTDADVGAAETSAGRLNRLYDDIRLWYNGYSWDGKNRVYIPTHMGELCSVREE